MPSSVLNHKLEFLSKQQLFGSWTKRRQAHPLYLEACKFFSCVLIDRTETLDFGIHYHILDPISQLGTTNKSFAQICLERAEQISQTNPNQKITLLWSGGIDSTVALISFLRILGAKSELHRLHVLLSKESIQEFPAFFANEIEGKLEYRVLQSTIYDAIDPKDINVTGEHGDQLFGSDKLKYTVQTGEAFRPYSDILFYIISRKLGTDKHADALIDYLQPQIKAAPIPIHTLYDYLWWMNFSLKWQYVSLRLLYGLEKGKFKLGENLIHFFQSADFQAWSLSNPKQKIRTDWKTYKYIAKEFIYAFYPDENYLQNKEKEQSLKEVIVRPSKLNLSNYFPWMKTK